MSLALLSLHLLFSLALCFFLIPLLSFPPFLFLFLWFSLAHLLSSSTCFSLWFLTSLLLFSSFSPCLYLVSSLYIYLSIFHCLLLSLTFLYSSHPLLFHRIILSLFLSRSFSLPLSLPRFFSPSLYPPPSATLTMPLASLPVFRASMDTLAQLTDSISVMIESIGEYIGRSG